MKKYFVFDPEKCSSCGACAVACMDQNDTDIEAGEMPFRYTFIKEETGHLTFYSVSCMHCEDAPCVTGCPVGCLRKDPETGFTLYDNTGCIGCHSCAMACPFGIPTFGCGGKMRKCDGCATRQAYGLQPACVKVCPTGALQCLTEAEFKERRLLLAKKKTSLFLGKMIY